MSKHRAERRRSARSVVWVTTAAASFAMLGALLVLWSSVSSPTAASETISAADGSSTAPAELPGLDQLVVYGHSMPKGGGASDGSLAYPVVAAEATGLELVNRAEGGTSAANAARTMASYPSPGKTDVVVVHTGMNDIFRRGEAAVVEGRGAIETLLAGTAEAGRRVVVLECQPPDWQHTPPHQDLQEPYEAWNSMVRGEAAAAGVEVLDTCAEWIPESNTDAPKFHPNDDGHEALADALVALLAGS